MTSALKRVHVPTPRSQWTSGTIYGLDDRLLDGRILDRSLSAWRQQQGIEPLTTATLEGPLLVVGDDIWISDRMIRDFVRTARNVSDAEPVRLVRDADGPGQFADPLGRLPRIPQAKGIAFDVWYLGPACTVEWPTGSPLPDALEKAVGVDVKTDTFELEVPVDPEASGGLSQRTFAVAPVAAAPISHWAELHRANLLALGTNALEAGPVWGVLALIWAVFRAMSINPYHVLAKLTRRGRGCRIHPKAVVEGCTLGDGVEVDAGAVLRGCVVGDGAKIGANAIAEFSVIGAGVHLTRLAMANLCVLYPNARIGGILQLAMAGEGATTKMVSIGLDMGLDKPVRVLTPDGLKAIDIGYQGICIGHRAFVASGVWIAPGRIVAPRRRLLRAPETIIRI
ncbi:MAG: hypothetical protein AAFS10_13700 [Myxococcota bacterium]